MRPSCTGSGWRSRQAAQGSGPGKAGQGRRARDATVLMSEWVLSRKALLVLAVLSFAAALPGCRIVKNGPGGAAAGQAAGATSDGQDPRTRADRLWDSRILPYLQAKAAPYVDLRRQFDQAPDAAIRAHGYRADNPEARAVLVARIDGTIVGADTKSRAGTIDVDVDGDNKPDVTVQIGPVLRGTALRDSLDFVSFSSFTNQIDYADFGKALNFRVRDTVLNHLPREGLVGRRVSLLGVFFAPSGGARPLVTPASLTLEGKAP
jgi:predicted lipoprotein